MPLNSRESINETTMNMKKKYQSYGPLIKIQTKSNEYQGSVCYQYIKTKKITQQITSYMN